MTIVELMKERIKYLKCYTYMNECISKAPYFEIQEEFISLANIYKKKVEDIELKISKLKSNVQTMF